MDRAEIIETGARALYESIRRSLADDMPSWDAAPGDVRAQMRGDVEAMLAAWEARGVRVEG